MLAVVGIISSFSLLLGAAPHHLAAAPPPPPPAFFSPPTSPPPTPPPPPPPLAKPFFGLGASFAGRWYAGAPPGVLDGTGAATDARVARPME